MKLRRKIASKDFTADMMPQTRKEVFIDVIKMHWFDMLKLGLILLLAFFPVLTVEISNDAYEMQILTQLGKNPTEEMIAKAQYQIAAFQSTSSVVKVIFYAIFSVALSGVLRVIRQYAWEEVVFLWRDFAIGIKQNWTQTMVVAVVFGIQNIVSTFLTGNTQWLQNEQAQWAALLFDGISLVAFLPIGAYMCILISIYSNSLFQNLKLACAVYAKTLGRTLINLLVLGCIFLITTLPWFLCHVLGLVIGVLLLPATVLIWFLFVSAQLDNYINPLYFPELVGRGLYSEKTLSDDVNSEDQI